MTPRDPQLTLPAIPDNDVAMDDIMSGARIVTPGDRALVTQAGEDGPQVAAQLGRKRSNQARGRLSQKHGAEFEAWLTGQHNTAMLHGPDRLLSWAIHIEAPTRVRKGRDGEKRLGFSGKAHADFVAMSTRLWGSRVIVIEAKSVSGVGERLYVADVRDQQKAHLGATRAEGGIAVLAVEFRESGARGFGDTIRRYAMAWGDIPWRVGGRGGWSIGAEDCAGYEVPPETGPKRASYLLRFLRSA